MKFLEHRHLNARGCLCWVIESVNLPARVWNVSRHPSLADQVIKGR